MSLPRSIGISFEVGTNVRRIEFVISAGGIKRAFPAVMSLVRSAPSLDGWTITAFRPRGPTHIVEIGDNRIDPENVPFTLLDNGQKAGIHL
jgi:hypothetical protein